MLKYVTGRRRHGRPHKVSIFLISIRSRLRMNERISEMVRPTSTKLNMKTSYICTQNKFVSNFGCHARYAH